MSVVLNWRPRIWLNVCCNTATCKQLCSQWGLRVSSDKPLELVDQQTGAQQWSCA